MLYILYILATFLLINAFFLGGGAGFLGGLSRAPNVFKKKTLKDCFFKQSVGKTLACKVLPQLD